MIYAHTPHTHSVVSDVSIGDDTTPDDFNKTNEQKERDDGK